MENVGSIEYDARISTKNIKSDAKNVERIAKDTGDNLGNNVEQGSNKAESALKGLGLKLVGVAASLAAVVGGAQLVSGALKDLAGLQSARSGFEVLTGSAEKASKVMGDIAKYANNTPFEFPEIAGAAKTLLGFGVAAEDVQKNIRQLGDAVAASGGEFSNVSRVFGQIFAAGKVNAEDFNQLIDNGIALGPEIAKELGIPIKDLKDNIEKGKVTFDVFQKALARATSEGGKYFGATDKLALTLNGRISTLKDTFTGFIGEIVGVDFTTGIVKANGTFDSFSNIIASSTKYLSGPGIKSFKEFQSTVEDIASRVIKYLSPAFDGLGSTIKRDLLPAFKSIVNSDFVRYIAYGLVLGVKTAIESINFLIRTISGFASQASQATSILVGLTAGFVAFNVITKVVTVATLAQAAAQGVLNAVMKANPYVLLASAAIGIVAAYASVVSQADRNTSAHDRLKAAQDAMKLSTDAAKEAQDKLRGALLGAEGAGIRVEFAQRAYNDAVAQYGPKSLEARDAAYNLKTATDDLATANANVRDRTNEAAAAENEKTRRVQEFVNTNNAIKNSAMDAAYGYNQLTEAIGKAREADKKAGGPSVLGKNETKLMFPNTQFGQRAAGGPVSANTPYIVGENSNGTLNKTSELFVPRTSGSIVNSSDLQSALGGSGNKSIENNIGNVYISKEADGEKWLRKLTQNQEIVGKGLTPQTRYA